MTLWLYVPASVRTAFRSQNTRKGIEKLSSWEQRVSMQKFPPTGGITKVIGNGVQSLVEAQHCHQQQVQTSGYRPKSPLKFSYFLGCQVADHCVVSESQILGPRNPVLLPSELFYSSVSLGIRSQASATGITSKAITIVTYQATIPRSSIQRKAGWLFQTTRCLGGAPKRSSAVKLVGNAHCH